MLTTLQSKLIAALGVILLLVGVYFKGRTDGADKERELWQAGVEITLQAYATASEEALNSREALVKALTDKTTVYIQRTKKYYETNPDPVCLDKSRGLYVGESRRSIASDGGGKVTGDSD